ncbi:ABC transporter permease [Alicyclobacillus mengziensis]|uniref:ABC transporter permease n=1 Tax=Alicyclobacillus mengziensis TaxID=2931921 RepID=A0A9X7Z971_9BACL|nr:ABC transporter permease [Alicyclobacillus mengziensis]QSO49308.1 ABC transporter permease [Alicyclobacillus mengziensis]
MNAQLTSVEPREDISLKTRRRRRSGVRHFFTSLVTNIGGLVGAIIILIAIVCAVFAPYISPHDPTAGSIFNRLLPPAWMKGGNASFLLGTDPVGRDVLSRIIWGARDSLYIGISSIILSLVIGVPVGLVAGYFGRWVDDLLMRITDVMLTFPFILLAILVMALFGTGVNKVVIVLGVSGWASFARVVRSQVLSLRENEYVMAAMIIGAPTWRILGKHIFPGTISPITVIATMNIAVNILLASGLSYLGLGVDPSIPDWGGMLASGQIYLTTAWWVDVFPGIALMLTVLGFNLFGDWLRDYLEPQTK